MGKEVIIRETYLNKVKPYLGTDLIKVFTGQRRVGKSFILKMIAEYLDDQNHNSNIIFIDKELFDFDSIVDYKDLVNYVNKKFNADKKNYLFIDEIQEINEFEKGLRHYQNQGNIEIFCTGSNANMLSGDLATLLSGRYIQIQVNNLSYIEFLKFHNLENSDETLVKYLKWGGLPFIKNLHPDDEVIYDYLSNIISTIIYKDVVYRHNIRNIEFFDTLTAFMASNTGNLITAQKISQYLKSQKTDISTKVVLNYLEYLQNAFLLHKLKRLDVKSKKVFETNNKYFFEDWGLRNALIGLSKFAIPDLLENVVFSHLKQNGFEVSVGVLKNKEIDFVAEKSGSKLYIQVAYLIPDEKVKKREFGNLLEISDNYQKLVVSMDPYPIGNFEGVNHMHLRDFLMKSSF
ncbi:ATP-binding protein [Salinivirga cyanobacteriivorans]